MPPARVVGSNEKRQRRPRFWAFAAGLVLLVFAIYARTGRFESLDFDDGEYVFANPNVLSGLTVSGIRWAFTTFHAANWHPLTWVSHMLDVQLFGPDPGAHHLVNAAIHAANAVVLFLVLRAATGAFWPSAAVAALFAVHPLNVESVAWISQRKSVLSTLFLFLAIGGYVRWTRHRSAGLAFLTALLLALGLLAKSMLVTAPFLFLLLDFWPLARWPAARFRTLLVEEIPLFLPVVAAAAATVVAQAGEAAIGNINRFPITDRLSNALVSSVAYLRDAIWPAKLACFYPHPATLGESVGIAPTIGSAALLAGITSIVILTRRTRPWLFFGWAWYLVSLVPVIGLVQVGSQARADRYTYVPMIGIFVAVVWEFSEIVRERRIAPTVVAFAGSFAIVVLAALAFVQAGYWRNPETLYTHALRVTRNNWLADNNLGNYWFSKHQPQRALVVIQDAIRIKPDYEEAYYNQGVALMNLGRSLDAIAAYRRNLELDPSNTDGWINLGFVMLNLGRFPEALLAYEKALSQRADDPLALRGAALTRANLGDPVAALEYLRRLERVDPARAAELRRDLANSR